MEIIVFVNNFQHRLHFHLFLNPAARELKPSLLGIARLPESEIFAQRPPHSDLARFAQEAKLAGMFKLRVDTGGTFTDCWGMAEGDTSPRLAKVLSSGRLRLSVGEWLSPTELTLVIPEGWRIADSFSPATRSKAATVRP